jgi:DNA-directed RNA polymerase subunit RPC12/RpoP
MKILEIPFETVYKCDLCGVKFEIEPNDLSIERARTQAIDGDIRNITIGLYVDCPYCGNEIEVKRTQENVKGKTNIQKERL